MKRKTAECGWVTLTFDDGYRETFRTVLPLLKKYDVTATMYIIAGKLGDYFDGIPTVTVEDLADAAAQRIEVGSHGYNHISPTLTVRSSDYSISEKLRFLITSAKGLRHVKSKSDFIMRGALEVLSPSKMNRPVTVGELLTEAQESKRILDTRLRQSTVSFAYPYGKVLGQTQKILEQSGYMSARTTFRGFNRLDCLSDLFRLKSMLWLRGYKAKDANLWVDDAVSSSAWLIETLHVVGDTTKEPYRTHDLAVEIGEFEEHLKYIHELVANGVLMNATQEQFASIVRKEAKEA